MINVESGLSWQQERWGKRTNEVEEVLEDEEEENLRCHGLQGGEGDLVGLHSESLSGGVEQPDLG